MRDACCLLQPSPVLLRTRSLERRINHLLEGRTAIVGGAAAGLDIVLHDRPATRRVVTLDLAPLVGDRQVALGLPAGRDTKVGDDTGRRVSPRHDLKHVR